jgi:hypothetical protein
MSYSFSGPGLVGLSNTPTRCYAAHDLRTWPMVSMRSGLVINLKTPRCGLKIPASILRASHIIE